jgi:hypothetical protein
MLRQIRFNPSALQGSEAIRVIREIRGLSI